MLFQPVTADSPKIFGGSFENVSRIAGRKMPRFANETISADDVAAAVGHPKMPFAEFL